jgi:hypothetical protein
MRISRVERLDLHFVPKPWAFADQRRGEIDEHFAAAQRANPRLWNGRVLVMRDHEISGGVLRGSFFETDYASFHAWLRWGCPPAEACDCFGTAVVQANDGAFLLAQMAAHTANAGRIYFPCGTPDLSDVRGEKVDFDGSIGRELLEETGLDMAEFDVTPGWTILEEAARVVAFKVVRAPQSGEALRKRVEGRLAAESNGELAAIHLVRGPAELAPAMPDYVRAFLQHAWS